MSDIEIVKFNKKYNRHQFDCGVETLNKYIKEYVSSHVKNNITACYLAIEHENVIGYFTLSASSMSLTDLSEDLKKKMPRYPSIPVFLVGRLAVDKIFHGQRLGEKLLVNILEKCLELSDLVGAYAIIVDVQNDKAKTFYQKYGFKSFEDKQNSLYIPLSTVKKLCN
jgi:predicted GNAT family N-acyltransferase